MRVNAILSIVLTSLFVGTSTIKLRRSRGLNDHGLRPRKRYYKLTRRTVDEKRGNNNENLFSRMEKLKRKEKDRKSVVANTTKEMKKQVIAYRPSVPYLDTHHFVHHHLDEEPQHYDDVHHHIVSDLSSLSLDHEAGSDHHEAEDEAAESLAASKHGILSGEHNNEELFQNAIDEAHDVLSNEDSTVSQERLESPAYHDHHLNDEAALDHDSVPSYHEHHFDSELALEHQVPHSYYDHEIGHRFIPLQTTDIDQGVIDDRPAPEPIHVGEPHAIYSHYSTNQHGHIYQGACQNGGIFISLAHLDYQCICPARYLGKNCNERNYCKPNPCKNDGKCYNLDVMPRHKCECQIGYYGTTCERINPCHPNPCRNGGSCTHDGYRALCVCPARFIGEFCEDLINCYPNPCQNGGYCSEKHGEGKFECFCPPEYRGPVCEDLSYCFNDPCKHGGKCSEDSDGFKCSCIPPWTGQICTDRVCDPNPCKNAGTCLQTGEHLSYKCICPPWATGPICDEARPCLLKPCKNGGTCIDSYSGFHWSFSHMQYYCICRSPYEGVTCEKNPCLNCSEHARCVDHKCLCDEGYKGDGYQCTITTEIHCHPNPCENGGICEEAPDFPFYRCQCRPPYEPPNCARTNPCKIVNCLHGKCVVKEDGSFVCVDCVSPWTGPFCDVINVCLKNPCLNNGECKAALNSSIPTCLCKGKWTGKLCGKCGCLAENSPLSVLNNPAPYCDTTGQCRCNTPYYFDEVRGCVKNVDRAGNPCENVKCQNGGTCRKLTETTFVCDCLPGYYGKLCELRSQCADNPCKNGGTCREVNGKFTRCDCPAGTNPPFCTLTPKVVPYCDMLIGRNPCLNGGTCLNNGNSYDCVCPIKYTGPNCGTNKCADCDRKAQCIAGRCRCKEGYIGNGYQCIKESSNSCQYCPQYAICIDDYCQCNPGYTMSRGQCIQQKSQYFIPPNDNNRMLQELQEGKGEGRNKVPPTPSTGVNHRPTQTAVPVTKQTRTNAAFTTSGLKVPRTTMRVPVLPSVRDEDIVSDLSGLLQRVDLG